MGPGRYATWVEGSEPENGPQREIEEARLTTYLTGIYLLDVIRRVHDSIKVFETIPKTR